MPLDTNEEWVVGSLHGLDYTVKGTAADRQSRSRAVDGLMVGTVDGDDCLTGSGHKERMWGKDHMVCRQSCRKGRPVLNAFFSGYVGQILINAATQGNIDQLHSPADSQNWFFHLESGFKQGNLALIPNQRDSFTAGTGFFPEEKRVNVWAAGK